MPTYRVQGKKIGLLDVEADGFKIEGGVVLFYRTFDDGGGADVGLIPLEHVRSIFDLALIKRSTKEDEED